MGVQHFCTWVALLSTTLTSQGLYAQTTPGITCGEELDVSAQSTPASVPRFTPANANFLSVLKGLSQASRDLIFGSGPMQKMIFDTLLKGEPIGVEITNETTMKSFKGLSTIWRRWDRFGSELVMVNGDIFVEGYFRQQRYETHEADGPQKSFGDYSRAQPWFEWDAADNTYTLKMEGAQQRLLEQMRKIIGENVTLYRGLSGRQAEIIRLIAGLRKELLTEVERTEYVNKMKKIVIQYADFPDIQSAFQAAATGLQSTQDLNQQKEIARKIIEARFLDKKGAESFFTTPTQTTALSYGQDVLKSVVPVSELLRLSQSTNLYAGIEYTYFEIMFYGLEGIESFADHLDVTYQPPAKGH